MPRLHCEKVIFVKVTINEDGRTNVECPKCGKIFNPHIIYPRLGKLVICIFCNHKFIVQAQKRNDKFIWVRKKFIHPLKR